jgi:uncharacterized damage-inducible protein DinB
MDLLDRLLDHDNWATTQLLHLTRGLSDAQLDETFDIGHETLRGTFEHAIFNIQAWTAEMLGLPLDAQRDRNSPDDLIDRHARAWTVFADAARRLREEGRLDDTFVDEMGERMTFGGAIVHVVLHDAEHRSEALHILQRLGVPDLPELDHGLWDHLRRASHAESG